MKTIIFASASVAALMLASAATAQSTASPNMTTQTNSSHSALIDQIGSSSDTANIHQDDASVTRLGVLKDSAVSIQGGPGFAGSSANNNSSINQSGAGQQALTMQANTANAGNTVTVDQSGNGSHAFGYQFGTGNTASITQTMTSDQPVAAVRAQRYVNDQSVNSSADNQNGIDAAVALRTRTTDQARSDVFYKRGAASGIVVQDWAANDQAALTQSGSANTGQIVQTYENGSAAKLQQNGGSNNVGYVVQSGSSGTGSNNSATLIENGGNNTSALISQIDSTGSVANTTTNNNNLTNAYTYQSGAQNYANVSQTNVTFGTADVRQTGGFDTASVTQTNTSNSTNALVMQGLANSWASVTQMNADNSKATISQGAVNSFKSGR